jgi:hypothetical protein
MGWFPLLKYLLSDVRGRLWLSLVVPGISYGEAHLYQSVLIQCQSYHVNYACSCARVDISSDDVMVSTTQVPIVRCAWVFVAVSCRARH